MAANPETSADYSLANTLFPILDRRASPRLRTVCFDVKVVRGENAGLFRARNISDTGIKLDTHWRLTPGERVLVKLSERLATHGTVSWSDGKRCGIEFCQPIDSSALLRTGAELKRDDRRGGALRLATMTRATCYAENGIRAVKVTDISHYGMGLAHDGSLAAGMLLKLISESGVERNAAVRWAAEGRAGVRLTDPLTCEELERLGERA
jgi:hypothetical protein